MTDGKVNASTSRFPPDLHSSPTGTNLLLQTRSSPYTAADLGADEKSHLNVSDYAVEATRPKLKRTNSTESVLVIGR
jgi:multidrug efflux pump subunit AcrB